MRKIDNELIEKYKNYLIDEERSQATVGKYVRDICFFCKWLSGREVNKRLVLEYKESLMGEYAPRSVNSVISSLNSLFDYLGWHDCRVKTLKIQKQIFADRDSVFIPPSFPTIYLMHDFSLKRIACGNLKQALIPREISSYHKNHL